MKNEKIADVLRFFPGFVAGNAYGQPQFTSRFGQPGSSASLSIRGMGSFNASNSPLYVIDGVPGISGSINSISSDGGLMPCQPSTPSDIENITIIRMPLLHHSTVRALCEWCGLDYDEER